MLGLTRKMNGGTKESLLDDLNAEGIGQAVIHAESEGGEDAEVLNTATERFAAEDPQRFKAVGGIDIAEATPTRMAAQTADLAVRGFVGLTLQPAFFGIDIDDRSLYPMYSRAEETGLVLCLHTGINYSRLHPMRHERAEMVDQVACDFPDLRIMACHAGWPWATEFAAVARRHPTVYLEFGAIAPKYIARPGTGWDVIFGMIPNVLRDQVLYGSDWPMMQPERALREWRAAGLHDSALKSLFTDNSQRLFGFGE
ncbi:amidohydrolase family protein [Brevibacterium aurantiacum]|uniref:amidohydrolase family protein n=1 Tax=Brevibacterium aurantiacum TaxID=273384 RepID=UPI0018687515|nr:amidohydrolase family protein [Brevibacterium aurantiacum]